MLKRLIFLLVFIKNLLICTSLNAQDQEEKIKLPNKLKEISGLELINDTLLVAHNDSGNKAKIYFLKTDGNIIHTCNIFNATNIDWEDITQDDKGYLYIADVGNNLNTRKDLCIYKIKVSDAIEQDSVEAHIISFHYADQLSFPPPKENFNFNCEAIYWQNDSLYLVTKSKSEPWTGLASIYVLSCEKEDQIAVLWNTVFTGKKSWMKDAVTGASATNETFCLLTYNRMIFYSKENNSLVKKGVYKFKNYDQKEAIIMKDESKIFVGAEKHRILGGPYLYIITKQ